MYDIRKESGKNKRKNLYELTDRGSSPIVCSSPHSHVVMHDAGDWSKLRTLYSQSRLLVTTYLGIVTSYTQVHTRYTVHTAGLALLASRSSFLAGDERGNKRTTTRRSRRSNLYPKKNIILHRFLVSHLSSSRLSSFISSLRHGPSQ